jgi:uncharacterized protein (TIGR02757 family)
MIERTRLRALLENRFDRYNREEFIDDDPVSIPHRYTKKQDIEISGLLAATLAWGQRKTILAKSGQLMDLFDNAPYDFIRHHKSRDLKRLRHFTHRTFKPDDLIYFVTFLRHHFQTNDSLEACFAPQPGESNVGASLSRFRDYFFSLPNLRDRTKKHVATPSKGSTCKRLNMYLRWMVRADGRGVDFGLWRSIEPSQLVCPVDVHVGRVARALGLIERKQTDWLAAVELTDRLKELDPADPVRFDFALFGLGVIEGEL